MIGKQLTSGLRCGDEEIYPNILLYVGYKSNWKCYHCLERDNLTEDDMYCKHCKKGINPFYFFIKNKRNKCIKTLIQLDPYFCNLCNIVHVFSC